MNTHIFFGVLAANAGLSTIASLAFTATAFDFDGARAGLRSAAVTVALAVLFAVLLALAVPA